MITADMLRKQWPHAPRETIDGVIAVADEVFMMAGIDTSLRVAHFMAQISHECGAGTIVRENMNYSADRLMQIFGVGKHSAAINSDEAQRLAHNPQAIAERVYGLGNPRKAKELGNTKVGDGYAFRGNGMLQLTGRGSHTRVGEETGFDLAGDPRMLEDPGTSFRVAAAEFVELKCLSAADADNVGLVTKRVNGGANGLAERKVWLRRWKTVLDGIEEPPKLPRGASPQVPKPLMASKIAQASVGAGGFGLLSSGAQVLQSFSDVSDKAKGASDNAASVITTAKPLLSVLPLSALVAIGVAGALAATAFAVWALIERRKKLYDEGV